MEKLVMNANAAVASRQQVLEILIESDSPNLRALCMKLLDEPTMKLWAARGLAKFDDLEIAEKLIACLTDFTTEERSEVVEMLCGRVSWAASLLQAIDSDGASKACLTPIMPCKPIPLRMRI